MQEQDVNNLSDKKGQREYMWSSQCHSLPEGGVRKTFILNTHRHDIKCECTDQI